MITEQELANYAKTSKYPAFMHDSFIQLILKKCPSAVHGKDFLVANWTNDSGTYGRAFIAKWAIPNTPEPTQKEIDIWWDSTDGQQILHPTYTPDELRARMKPLTRRQFWLGASAIGVTKDTVKVKLIEMADNDPEMAAYMQIEMDEAISYERLHPAVVSLSPLFSITPEQIDALWDWADDL